MAMPTNADIRTDNVGSFDAWDKANRAESMLDLNGLTEAETLQVAVWYASVLQELYGAN